METLPESVKMKMENPESDSKIPTLSDYEVYQKICAASKPKSGVPGDLPRRLVSEFAPELATPVCIIFNHILRSAEQGAVKWPTTWKQELGIPLQKVADPQTEDDLRIISLTPFFSKVLERFVVNWLMAYIGNHIDPKQFGGLKGNSINHYIIELINFILYNQDFNLPIAVLACTVVFSKAFNRQNHNLLILKLSEMGVPGWLLNVVSGFLLDRSMVVKYKGVTTESKNLPGGGPQGTLLGLLLFLVLVNQCGFEANECDIGEKITVPKGKFQPGTLHMKYVDDLTIAESIDLKETLVENENRPLPDPYHSRLGLKLPEEKSMVYDQINKIHAFANENEMRMNFSKTKFIIFNPASSYDFQPGLTVGKNDLEYVDKMKLLGLTLTSDLKWKENTVEMIKKANKKLWMLKRLKKNGASLDDLKDVYCKQVRSILEFGVPVWNCGLTQEEIIDIERVQKSFLYIALGNAYHGYGDALEIMQLETLEDRRSNLSKSFALKALKH